MLEKKFDLTKAKTAEGTGTSYPAGIAVAPNGKFVYVAENVGDRLAVVSAATGEIVQRFPTDHYPYGVARTRMGSCLSPRGAAPPFRNSMFSPTGHWRTWGGSKSAAILRLWPSRPDEAGSIYKHH